MAVFKCKMCGGHLQVESGKTTGICDYCGTQQTLPRLDDDRRAQMYDRANHFRRNNDYDKAAGIYETILNEDTTDAEAYWSLVLCKFGVEYVEDPKTKQRMATCNRAQLTSILADEDYKQALASAGKDQRTLYEEEAREIDEIQKGILEVSSREEPFDVFICYKETDEQGKRTRDSVIAQDLYHELQKEGFKVFFARITLENVLGTAYEPYIFAALNSSKVMVVVGSKKEYFNAIWVKNEWSRYLGLIKGGAKKILIPAYRDIDAYDLPDDFSHLQAQDMNKLGFMQDLVRGIKKITGNDIKKVVKETIPTLNSGIDASASVDSLLKRGYLFLEDGEFTQAHEYFNRVLDIEPENARSYIGLLCIDTKVKKEEELVSSYLPLGNNANYAKAFRFADDSYKEILKEYEKANDEKIAKKIQEDQEKQEEKESQEEAARAEEARLKAEAEAKKKYQKEISKNVKKIKKWNNVFKAGIWWLILLPLSFAIGQFLDQQRISVPFIVALVFLILLLNSPIILPLFIISIYKKRIFKKKHGEIRDFIEENRFSEEVAAKKEYTKREKIAIAGGLIIFILVLSTLFK